MNTTTNDLTPTCKCGGSTYFIGNQRFVMFNYQRPLFNCHQCGTTLAGAKEPLTEVQAVQHGNE